MEHFALRLQLYLWLLGYLKVVWEAEPSGIRHVVCGPSFQLGFGRQRPFLLLRLG